jgi:ribosomal protein L22
MSPDKPANPSQGRPDDVADAAAEAKEEFGQEEAAEAAEAPEEPKAKPKRTRKPKQPKAEAEKAVEDEAVAPAAEEPAAEAEDEPAAEEEPEAGEAPQAEEEPEAEEQPKRRRAPRRRRSAEADEEPAEEAPKPARRERPADGAPVIVRAQARYVRSSARKARLVCDLIRGKSVEDARAVLALSPRAAARDWSKLLESAVANAENNHELDGEDMRILTVKADEGPTLKRYRPRAMGRATRIRKRTSHLTIHLTPKG